MCGRYVSVSCVDAVEKRFGVRAQNPSEFVVSANVCPGDLASVITSDHPSLLQQMRFGLTPSWSTKSMMLINARAEGDHNPENQPAYQGAKGIINKPAFRMPIRRQRCLIPADAFYEGPETEKLDRPFLVYPRLANYPFAFAGVWDTWRHPNGSSMSGFSIITAPANQVLQRIGHHRCPVILPTHSETLWLDPRAPLADITALLTSPGDEFLNAYPVSTAVKPSRNKSIEILKPVGERLFPEYEFTFSEALHLEGMGQTTARRLRNDEIQGSLF